MTKTTQKICRDCHIIKPLTEYYSHKDMSDGTLNKCKTCVKERIHKYWADGRGKDVDKKRNLKPTRIEWKRQQSKRMAIKHKKRRAINIKWGNYFRYNKHLKNHVRCVERQ